MPDFRFWRWRTVQDDELDRELEVHLALEIEEQVEAGVPLRDAKLAARRAFGSIALTKEELRDMRTGATFDRLGRDMRHAARRLVRTPIFTLATVLTLALAIGANVANLFLVRSDAKQREVAVRRALGAGNGGIAGYFLAESAWLALAGGALGLALAWGAVRLLVAFGPTNLPRLHEVRLDGVALAFTIALSLATGIVFGSIPLLRLAPLAVSLHESGRSNTASRARSRTRQLHGRTNRAGARAPRVVRPHAAQLSEAARHRSGLRRGIRADVPRRIAPSRLSGSRPNGRRVPRDSRPAVRVARRDGRLRCDLPAALGSELRGWSAVRRRSGPSSRRERADGQVRCGRRWFFRDHGHAGGSRPEHRSKRCGAKRAGRRGERGARQDRVRQSRSDRATGETRKIRRSPGRSAGSRSSASSRTRRRVLLRSRLPCRRCTCRCLPRAS